MKNHRWCWHIKAGPGDLGVCAKAQLADVWKELERYPRWHGERAALRMRGAARCLGQRLRASREQVKALQKLVRDVLNGGDAPMSLELFDRARRLGVK